MKLVEEILALSDGTTLSAEERGYVQLILGIPQDTGNQNYVKSEARFTLMASNIFFNKAIRVIISKYGKLGDDVVELAGDKKYKSDEQRLRFALMLQNFVFPVSHQTPLEDVLTVVKDRKRSGSPIVAVPVTYGGARCNADDFGMCDSSCPVHGHFGY
jgi:hypothetical protein